MAQLPKRTLKINAELPPSSVHGTRVVFLHFAGQMAFSDPCNSVIELVGYLDLIEKMRKHLFFRRVYAVDGCLADGKKDIKQHRLGLSSGVA